MSRNRPRLTDATDDELRAEIERRATQKQITPPDQVTTDAGFVALRNMIIEIVSDACEHKYWTKDHKQYIYELAMQAVYGQGFWPWKKSINWDGE